MNKASQNNVRISAIAKKTKYRQRKVRTSIGFQIRLWSSFTEASHKKKTDSNILASTKPSQNTNMILRTPTDMTRDLSHSIMEPATFNIVEKDDTMISRMTETHQSDANLHIVVGYDYIMSTTKRI